MTQLNQNTTNLQSILDAVNALPEATSVSGTISITTNGTHDVARYATANVNVQSAPVLLWTNASPTSTPTSLALQFSGTWDAYFVECRFAVTGSGNDYPFITYITVSGGASQKVVAFSGSPTRGGSEVRGINAITNSSITFMANQYISTCIPTRIWGVKFTL